jgi:hypothetical protein
VWTENTTIPKLGQDDFYSSKPLILHPYFRSNPDNLLLKFRRTKESACSAALRATELIKSFGESGKRMELCRSECIRPRNLYHLSKARRLGKFSLDEDWSFLKCGAVDLPVFAVMKRE